MRKLIYLLLLSVGLALLTPNQSYAQPPDSTCQIFGTGNTLTIDKGATKRFYTKYVAGASYGWSVIGGNAYIVGPRNLYYVDVYGVDCGTAELCVSYNKDGMEPCCKCVNITIVGCTPPPGGSCCIHYVNSTMQPPWVKVKFQVCSQGVTSAKLFKWNGSAYELLWTDSWPSGYNPAYTYNLNIGTFSCNEIFCLKICGYSNGVECCTTNFAIRIVCDPSNTYFTGVEDYNYPGCNAPGGGGGGGIEVNKPAMAKEKLLLNPNPASNTLQVSFPQKNNISSLQVVDRSGNVIATYSVKGKSSFIIPVMNLKTGDYIIKPDDPMIESAIFIKQ
jgi:hypothetical protein